MFSTSKLPSVTDLDRLKLELDPVDPLFALGDADGDCGQLVFNCLLASLTLFSISAAS